MKTHKINEKNLCKYTIPGEPKTFIFGGYDPYIEGLKPSFFMVLGSKGTWMVWVCDTYPEVSEPLPLPKNDGFSKVTAVTDPSLFSGSQDPNQMRGSNGTGILTLGIQSPFENGNGT